MGHIIMTTFGTHGDIFPFLAIGQRLRARGHAVSLITHCVYADQARQSDLEFVALDTPEEYAAYTADSVRLVDHLHDPAGAEAFRRDHIVPKIQREYALIERLQRPGESLILARHLTGATLGHAALLAAERFELGIAWLVLAPTMITSLELSILLERQRFTHEANELRAALGLAPIRDGAAWLAGVQTSLCLWPDWFAAPQPNWPEGLVLSGFVLNDQAEGGPIPLEVQRFLAAGPAPVLISGGSGKLLHPDFYHVSAAACRLLGRRALLVTRFPELVPQDLPPTIMWVPQLPFASVMPLADCVIHHGGIGTVGRGLASGVPQLVLAASTDRPENAMYLQRLGVGEYLLSGRWQPERIAASLQRLSGAIDLRQRCRDLAAQMRTDDPVETASGVIAGLLGRPEARLRFDQSAPLPEQAQTAPALPATDPRLARLSPERRALLALRLGQQAAAHTREQRIPAVSRAGQSQRFPLSFAQRRLWFLDQLNPGSTTYNAGAAFRLCGHLDEQVLQRSLSTIVQRHDILRTVFPSEDGLPFQQVLPHAELPWSVIDLRELPANQRSEAVRRYVLAEAHRIYDLTSGPLFRTMVLRSADQEHCLILSMHHIVVDGWSVGVLIRELMQLYNALSAGQTLALADPPIQYADYALWQERWLASPALQRQLDYWTRQLAGAPAAIDLPAIRQRDSGRGFAGGRHRVFLDRDQAHRLQRLAEAEGATLFMGLLLLFATTLQRASAQDDILVGTLIANRRQPELHGLIGFLVNTLVLRVRFDQQPTFREMLRQVREVTLAAYEHQDVPFEKVIEQLQPERNLRAAPLAQVLFNLHDSVGDELRLTGLTAHYLEYEKGLAGVDLALDLWRHAGGIEGVFEWNTALFDEGMIEQFSRVFQALLACMVADPDVPVAFAPLLPPEQAQAVLAEGLVPVACSDQRPVHLLIAEQAAAAPAAPAIRYGGETLSYAELEQRANQFAHALRQCGVLPGDIVALMLATGPQQVVALLGVLKAGAVFSVLEPGLPERRVEAILAQQMPRALVASPHQLSRLAELAQRALPTMPPLLSPDAPELDRRPDLSVQTLAPDAPIYIVSTSGSTGTPKGIVQSHGSFRQFVDWFVQEFRLGPGQRVAQWATLSYDAAYCEIFATLCAGATLCLADPTIRYEPLALLSWLQAERIGLFQTVPSFASQLLHLIDDDPALAPALDHLLLAGEVLPVELAAAWRRVLPAQARLYNLYGPTEAILATYHLLPDDLSARRIIPVGRAIPGRQILVLDRAGHLCPPGVIGEIVIRSPFLTIGYQNQPALTAERFRADPFAPGSGQRCYHTGDQGRWLSDATLEFCGRADQQVKLRGMRVELAEIEVALMLHPAVRAAAVVLRADPEHDARLIAYIVADKAGMLDTAALRAHLAERVPEALLPAAFVRIDALPLTRNGKLDRRALPEPEATDLVHSAAVVAPRTPTEQALAELWGDLLDVPRPGIHDNFFAVGGHSLLATRLLARIRQHFQADLSLLALFEGPTIADLAVQIDRAKSARAETRVARALARLSQLSDEEVQQLLQQKRQTRHDPEGRPVVEPR